MKSQNSLHYIKFHYRTICNQFSLGNSGGGEGEVVFLQQSAGMTKSVPPSHDAQVVEPYLGSNPSRLTVLAVISEDHTTAPQHLKIVI